jgi:ABC-2 type transport system ATP-binding protein
MDSVIELDGLEVRFGNRAILKKLNARLTGRAIGLLGPNGAGKSTLLNTLLGFQTASGNGADLRQGHTDRGGRCARCSATCRRMRRSLPR